MPPAAVRSLLQAQKLANTRQLFRGRSIGEHAAQRLPYKNKQQQHHARCRLGIIESDFRFCQLRFKPRPHNAFRRAFLVSLTKHRIGQKLGLLRRISRDSQRQQLVASANSGHDFRPQVRLGLFKRSALWQDQALQ